MILEFVGFHLANFLTLEPTSRKSSYYQASLNDIKSILEPCDVVLIEGRSRVSKAIQFITESNWSHAAVFIGKTESLNFSLVEMKLLTGCTYTDITYYKNYNLRICRPMFMTSFKKKRFLKQLNRKIGNKYDLKNIIDLVRYIFPNPPVPKKYRRNLIGIGAGNPTKAICSTLIAEAFRDINHPVLPYVETQPEGKLLRRHHSFCLPKDFDISPFFEIIKPKPTKTF